ncbi:MULTISPECIES: diguanylate cyclase [unclassified Marinobacter]|uniref:diguanylate cyclase n=1 Tax=unclassified Marinobacter TaxID=83889 RepID=UPI0019261540|nr:MULTISPECIES: diguanylate cyclase [unclassified Marinobacter]MBL3823329.1 diguanylate cyclase [Marinobacter sp. MC3]MBL3892340.1 diguanylate cyclase [Marinobacter sp. MW3]
MASQENGDVSEKLAALRQKFLVRASEDIQVLRAYAEQTRRGELSAEGLIQCYQQLHRLAGSAGTFGLPELGVAARALEKKLKSQAEELTETENNHSQTIDVNDGFADGVDALAKLVEVKSEISGQTRAAISRADIFEGSHGMQVSVIVMDSGCEGLASLSAEMARYGFNCQTVDQRVSASVQEVLADTPGAAAILCRDAAVADVMLLRNQATAKGLHRRLPVICIGRDGSFNNKYHLAKLGAFAFFQEPVDIPELAERIESLAIERSASVQGRVLIVEDDTELAEHYCLVLQSAGIEARTVSDPLDLMPTLSSFQPDIVLMDVQIGDYSGVTLARLIRFEPRWLSLPIIYLSSEDDPDNQLEALSKGADEFLMKPVSDDYLVRSVRIRCYRARQLSELMNRDSLTGLLKHSLIKQEVEKELARCRRDGHPSSLVMLDLDHFKQINDTWGHRYGDIVIRTLANLLRNRLRETDMIGRYGGEEFLVVLPHCEVTAAAELVRRIGESFAELEFSAGEGSFQVTLSAGVAAINDFANGDDALEAADQALYQRKRSGRNGVTVHSLQ